MAYSPLSDVPLSGKTRVTDYSRWRLAVTGDGRHTWHYLRLDEECEKWPQTALDKYWLGLPTVCTCRLYSQSSTHRSSFRICLLFRLRRTHWKPLVTGIHSTSTFKRMMVTGQASMEDPCSCFLVSSLDPMSLACHSSTKSVSK